MNWQILLTAFVSVFFAELGDKTQLATFTLSAGSGSKLSVFIGASIALVFCTALGVLAGDMVSRFVSPQVLKRIAGVIFIVLGVLYVRG